MESRRDQASPYSPGSEIVTAGGGARLERRLTDLRVHQPEPLPDATHLPLGSPDTRGVCWPRLPARISARITETTGERIEWWASMPSGWRTAGPGNGPDDRPQAVVFGDRAICFAEPRVDSDHRPVYSIERYWFDPQSHRRAEVIFRPPRPEPDPRADGDSSSIQDVATTAEDSSGSTMTRGARPLLDIPGLWPSARTLIGNLPVRAQKLVTAPFDAAHPVKKCDWYYEGSANRLNVFAVVLVGSAQATLAHGSRVIPVGHDDRTSHWSLICRRAAVVRQPGG